MHLRPRCARAALLALAILLSPVSMAGDVLDGIKARGELRCGVSEGIPGFSAADAHGVWRGFDVDFCRAVAAALLGSPDKVEFVPLESSDRFPALQANRIDLLVRNTSWTLLRETLFDLQFPAILFYDGQAFMVPRTSGITSVNALGGSTVCVEKGTSHQRNVETFARAHALKLTPQVVSSATAVADAFFAGRCQAYSSDASQLAAARVRAPGGEQAYVILPERISKEPLGPVVTGDDRQWGRLVRAVFGTLVIAEENGITQASAGELQDLALTQTAGIGMDVRMALAKALGVAPGWGVRAVRAVGNYGEMYARNFGSGGPLHIERGLNRLWSDGGLIYSPPID